MELTLLERFDTHYGTSACVCAYSDSHNEIRRAIAIAQAVEWYSTYDPQACDSIRDKADELLEGK